jgi:pantetheine-phosphate adenylyltransferase
VTKLRVGVYPGTFDPITTGHMDIIQRAARMLDRLVIGVAVNSGKNPLFTVEERVEMVREDVERLKSAPEYGKIEVTPFATLLMDFTVKQGASMIIRGLRAVTDFEYEFQMAGMNAKLDSSIETVFLMSSEGQQFIASRLIKEVGRLGGDVSRFVSPNVGAKLREKWGAMSSAGNAKQTPPF